MLLAADPELAAAVPNALAELYIESDLEARMAMNRKASASLTGQTAERKKKVAEAAQAGRLQIAGVDLNTCGGTHLASTAELEALALLDDQVALDARALPPGRSVSRPR